MMIRNLTLFFCLCTTFSAAGQYLISSEMIGSRTKTQLEAEFNQAFRSDITMYKITYETIGVGGGMDTASGLMVIPDEAVDPSLPIVAYQHGTTNGPESCPSRLTAGHTIPMIYGGMGYIASAADFLGLGDNKGFHPYLHAATQASAGLDMLIATTEYVENSSGSPWLGPLFISGYSQGGHAAAALQKELEANWSFVFPVTASTPMSGPYDLSGVMFDRVVSDEIYFFPSYIAYVLMGIQEAEGDLYNSLTDYMKEQYATQSIRFYNREITLFELNNFMINTLFSQELFVRPSRMFKDSILNILRNDTMDHPIKMALRDNDLYNWVPQAPTRLYYCEADEQVPFQNSLVADSVMNALGAADVTAMSMDPNANHNACATPAVTESIRFFDSFVLTSSSSDPVYSDLVSVYPNPAGRGEMVRIANAENVRQVEIYTLSGQHKIVLTTTNNVLDPGDLMPGVYLCRILHDRGITIEKLIIH